jgi:hypothetical protein
LLALGHGQDPEECPEVLKPIYESKPAIIDSEEPTYDKPEKKPATRIRRRKNMHMQEKDSEDAETETEPAYDTKPRRRLSRLDFDKQERARARRRLKETYLPG